jgi:hypothetical protein
MSVFRVKVGPGKEPCDWKVEKFADIDGEEMFIRHVNELTEILNATSISGKQRDDVRGKLISILIDGLLPAFKELKEIVAAKSKDIPILDRRELYHDFYRKLWKAYKDLTQRAALEMGFNIGFLYQKPSEFRKGLDEFRIQNPKVRAELGTALEEVRESWQNDLATFRNTYLEHQNSDASSYAKYYDPQYAAFLFDHVWNVIVDLLAVLLESKLFHDTKLARPDPIKTPNWRNRFIFDMPILGNKV